MGAITDRLFGKRAVRTPVFGEITEQDRITRRLFSGEPQIQREFTPTPEISTITGDPIQKFTPTGKPSATGLTQTKAGTVDEPAAKVVVFARARGIPVDRYGITKDGEIFFEDKGKFFLESKRTPGGRVQQMLGEQLARLPETVLAVVGATRGPAAAAGGAAVGELIRQGVGRLLVSDEELAEAQKALKLPIQERTKGEIAKDVGVSALLGTIGVKAGRAGIGILDITKGRQGARLIKAAGRDIKGFDIGDTKAIEALAQSKGITLFTPQSTGSPQLIARFNLLGDLPVTADKIGRGRMVQFEQIDQAINDWLGSISPRQVTPGGAGARAVEAAQETLTAAQKVRRDRAAPFYRKAFADQTVIDTDALGIELARNRTSIKSFEDVKPTLDIEKTVGALKADGKQTLQVVHEGAKAYEERMAKDFKRAFKKEPPLIESTENVAKLNKLRRRNDAITDTLAGKTPKGFEPPTKKLLVDIEPTVEAIDDLLSTLPSIGPSTRALKQIKKTVEDSGGKIQILDRIKRDSIDEILNKAQVSKTTRREMKIVKDALTKQMDELSPDYAKARSIFSEESIDVGAFKGTKIETLSKLEGDKAEKAAKLVFSPGQSSPEIVDITKQAIIKHGGQDAWDDLMKAHLTEVFDSIASSNTTNVGGMLRKKLFVNPNQRRIMQQAMTPEQFQNFNDLMTIFERTAKTAGRESTTATRQVSLGELEREAKGLGGRLIETATRPLLTRSRLAGDFITTLKSDRYKSNLADAMLSPEATKQLQRMIKLNPGSRQLITQLSTFLTLAGSGVIRDRPLRGTREQGPKDETLNLGKLQRTQL